MPDTTALESSSYATTVAATPASGKFTPASAKSPYDVAVAAKSGHGARIRLPDKLMEYLNGQVEPDVLWWQNDEGFAFDSTRVQTDFLDKHFEKTKLKSFIRSLNRWYVRRSLVAWISENRNFVTHAYACMFLHTNQQGFPSYFLPYSTQENLHLFASALQEG